MKKVVFILILMFSISLLNGQTFQNRLKAGVDYAFLGSGDQNSNLYNIEYNRNLYGNLSFRGKIGYGIASDKILFENYDEFYINNIQVNGPEDYWRSFFDFEIGLEFTFLKTHFTSLSVFSGLSYMDDSGSLWGGTRIVSVGSGYKIIAYTNNYKTQGFGGMIGLRYLIMLSGNISMDLSASRIIVEHSGSLNCGIGLGMGL